ncbi:hypothetical protein C8Q72DRAFT_906698 [Fomitopsis betulina]|nr:hypothetical protein C8Q72DRAFT_906698 [Fomitopsis betulina]
MAQGNTINILLFGATTKFTITTPVRSPEKAKLLKQLGAHAPLASLDDFAKVEALAANADVVLNIANADHLPGTRAMLAGMRRFHEATRRRPVLLHTSGAAEVAEQAEGKYATETVYSDVDLAQLKSIPESVIHRSIDLAVIAADEEGYARTYIITPTMIYGLASGLVFDKGIAKRTSTQIPTLNRTALERNVHVNDVAALFLTLFDTVRTDPERTGHGWEGYYFLENGHSSWGDNARAIGRALVELGVAPASEPTTFTSDEIVKFWGYEVVGNYWGSTCRCRADRAPALGWTPKYSAVDMLSEGLMRAEVEV